MIHKIGNTQLKRLDKMGKTKEMMEFYEYSDEYINEQIHLKLNVDAQHYIDLYEQDIQEELKSLNYEDKN